ncbi:ABC transporter substrate-binding protein [Acidocella sp.]|uniref:ABC transporter substrate-binding protein n=1 Tax=Acidocella sp. TaxID=50710 RepID=UPI003CFD5ADF
MPSGLEILLAPTTASILLARLVQQGLFPDAHLGLWRGPDQLRAAIVTRKSQLFTAPTNLPANLANRGVPVKLAAVIGMGHLIIVTSNPNIRNFHDLAGQKILEFFPHDMPALVFRACAMMEGMNPIKDMHLSAVGMPMEAAKMVASGQVETALLSEPWASAAILAAAQHGRILYRAINLQDVWIQHLGGDGIPMLGVGIENSLLTAQPDLPIALLGNLKQAQGWIAKNPGQAAELSGSTLGISPAVFTEAVKHSQIVVKSAAEARPDLELFYKTLLKLSPDILGGRLPDDSFYLSA